MGKLTIDQFTKQVMEHEKYFAFLTWKLVKQYNILLGKSDIEDIISDAYLKAVTKIRNDKHLHIKHPLAWFSKVIYLTAMNHLRKEIRKSKLIDAQVIEDINDTSFIYDTLDHHMQDEVIKKAREKLSAEEDAVIQLIIDGYSYEEISQRLHKREDAVRQVKYRAVKKLKQFLR